MFSRFKEKLSGFKEALSTKIQEKVSRAEELTGIKLDQKHEPEELNASKTIASTNQLKGQKPHSIDHSNAEHFEKIKGTKPQPFLLPGESEESGL